jgi:hypothetical protein
MAIWKKLTLAGESARKVDVNLDNAAFIEGHPDHTVITFAGTPQLQVVVRERPEDILMKAASRHAQVAKP